MGGDMVGARGRATVDGSTLFGHNGARPAEVGVALRLTPGRPFALGEKVHTQHLELPQARQTYTVLGGQAAGAWGYEHGVNERGVAAGHAVVRTRLALPEPRLLGTDLVRLTLERAGTARQAVDVLTDLVSRQAQTPAAGPGDGAFLLADGGEMFVVETSGGYWAYQEVHGVRAVGGVCTIRQDWNRVAHGLASQAIERGWWPADGSKLDFAGALGISGPDGASAQRRWERATTLLVEQTGRLDTAAVRRLLSDHFDGCPDQVNPFEPGAAAAPLCRHAAAGQEGTAASLVAPLPADGTRLVMAWCTFGPPCLSLYFPIFLDGDLPLPFAQVASEPPHGSFWWRLRKWSDFLGEHEECRERARDSFARLQGRFDQEAEEFAVEGAELKQEGKPEELHRQATLFMQHCLERFEDTWTGVTSTPPSTSAGTTYADVSPAR